nr:hypothetical protein Iba_chr12dCG18610 [Ipomoea batatas]
MRAGVRGVHACLLLSIALWRIRSLSWPGHCLLVGALYGQTSFRWWPLGGWAGACADCGWAVRLADCDWPTRTGGGGTATADCGEAAGDFCDSVVRVSGFLCRCDCRAHTVARTVVDLAGGDWRAFKISFFDSFEAKGIAILDLGRVAMCDRTRAGYAQSSRFGIPRCKRLTQWQFWNSGNIYNVRGDTKQQYRLHCHALSGIFGAATDATNYSFAGLARKTQAFCITWRLLLAPMCLVAFI